MTQTEEPAIKMEFVFVIYGTQEWTAQNVKNKQSIKVNKRMFAIQSFVKNYFNEIFNFFLLIAYNYSVSIIKRL